jgi:hypothetical protein
MTERKKRHRQELGPRLFHVQKAKRLISSPFLACTRAAIASEVSEPDLQMDDSFRSIANSFLAHGTNDGNEAAARLSTDVPHDDPPALHENSVP